ncbi:MAG: serine/threonine protein kinase [Myxococcales bacterium]|nr:serine/threonine protein kinase [Myxococcales bacterium]
MPSPTPPPPPALRCPRCNRTFPAVQGGRCPHDRGALVRDRAGEVVAQRYTLRDLVGVGGMGGEVWSAWQAHTERLVALKRVPAGQAGERERFTRGARIASNLSHPNIAVVHDHGELPDGGLFLAMELLDGHVLTDEIRQGPLPLERALDLLDQVLPALAHAHDRQVVHRDLKPDNLFVVAGEDDEPQVKVLDFGIARFADDAADSGLARRLAVEVTQRHQVCGTPQYMAPEQILRGGIDGRTDLYALGVVAWRMLCGRLPFNGPTTHEVLRAHVRQALPSLVEASGGRVPAAVAAVVHRALAKDPEDRYPDARAMRRALRAARASLRAPTVMPAEVAPTAEVPAPSPRVQRVVLHEPSAVHASAVHASAVHPSAVHPSAVHLSTVHDTRRSVWLLAAAGTLVALLAGFVALRGGEAVPEPPHISTWRNQVAVAQPAAAGSRAPRVTITLAPAALPASAAAAAE